VDDVAVGVGVGVGVVGVPPLPGGGVGVGVGVGVGLVVPFSIAVATISISPFNGTVLDVGNSVMTVPPGASKGTLSHAERSERMLTDIDTAAMRPSVEGRLNRASIRNAKDNTLMGLGGQDRGDRGYAMAALLVALAVMSVLLTIAMPVWRHEAQREKEAELVFRGEQYARAIALYRAKNQQMSGQPGTAQALPPSIDVLVQGRFLRKKYKDPMTKDGEFMVISMAQGGQMPGVPPAPGAGGGQTPNPTQPPSTRALQPPGMSPQGGLVIGGIQGVRSKSQESSLRTYRGATRYDQWAFMYTNVPRPGGMPAATPGSPNPGGPPGGPRRGGPGGPVTRPGERNTTPNPPPFGGSPIGRPGRGGRGPGL
jgi:type II secretory pathway pseudopilin PulG